MVDFKYILGLLQTYFYDESDEEGIRAVQHDINASDRFAAKWRSFEEIIAARALEPDQPLEAVQEGANRVLMDNTDEEAYRWLDLTIKNVAREDGIVESYYPPKETDSTS